MAKTSVRFSLRKPDGKHDTKAIKRGLDALPGVCSVSVSDSSGEVAVDYDTTGVRSDQIRQQLQELGYEIRESQ